MSEPVRVLMTLAKALSAMGLYQAGHPARERAVDLAYEELARLQRADPYAQFSFLGDEVVYGQAALREMGAWDWGRKLASVGIQRLEIVNVVSREEYADFLDDVVARLSMVGAPSTVESRPGAGGRRQSIRFGAIGIRGDAPQIKDEPRDIAPGSRITYDLGVEADAVRWMHDEVATRGELPLMEAEAVVRSLAVAMHGDSQMVLPLVQMKEFDQYTTTHSLNVSVLTMALAEHLRLPAADVRTFGVAGLLHDLGKVRIPKDILVKPGKLTDAEREVMQRHPVDGARLIVASDRNLDLAAVVAYEHHIMIDGGGYPKPHYGRCCHHASELVHVCDVYDALRTNRPYRAAWESERVLTYLEERAGKEFEPKVARAFVEMVRAWDQRVATVGGAVAGAPETA
ncbi:MAG TPA: HD domain-containing phosphohydrolase [Gemmatimonadaceae bacterium]|nr:HD domain-containing phosphohydrolase [Gemmatimonadaceae bacterium]